MKLYQTYYHFSAENKSGVLILNVIPSNKIFAPTYLSVEQLWQEYSRNDVYFMLKNHFYFLKSIFKKIYFPEYINMLFTEQCDVIYYNEIYAFWRLKSKLHLSKFINTLS